MMTCHNAKYDDVHSVSVNLTYLGQNTFGQASHMKGRACAFEHNEI